ncbi:MAG: long-chain-fatty-acid--CoA ligase [Solirubrobacterales bacterium]
MGLNLAEAVTRSAERHGTQTAVRLDPIELTYSQLEEMTAQGAAMLRDRGLEPGERVGLMLPNVPAFVVLYYAILRAGGVVVPMNVLLKRREVSYFLEDSGARLLLTVEDLREEAEAGTAEAGAEAMALERGGLPKWLAPYDADPSVAETAADDTAVILYTSGTTGQPKGAELTHANLDGNAEVVCSTLTRVAPGDVVLGALPLFHSFGQTAAMNASLRNGACLALLARFDPEEALEAMASLGVTVFLGVPTMYAAMLNLPGHERFDLGSLRTCVSGGQSMPAELLRGFEGAFGCKILEGYGLSETSPVACQNRPDRERKPGSIGMPIEGTEMKVVDDSGEEVPDGEVGEILIRGPNVMKGYWRRPEATEETISDGWLHSGDLGRRDSDGYFYVVDRKKEMIIRGGYNVYPREVEEVLYEHPDVVEAAVVGFPEPTLGEEIGAAVVLRPGSDATPEDLQEHVRSQLAAYKYPRRVWTLDELPKGPTGKILKREVQPPSTLPG